MNKWANEQQNKWVNEQQNKWAHEQQSKWTTVKAKQYKWVPHFVPAGKIIASKYERKLGWLINYLQLWHFQSIIQMFKDKCLLIPGLIGISPMNISMVAVPTISL